MMMWRQPPLLVMNQESPRTRQRTTVVSRPLAVRIGSLLRPSNLSLVSCVRHSLVLFEVVDIAFFLFAANPIRSRRAVEPSLTWVAANQLHDKPDWCQQPIEDHRHQ